MYNYIYISKDAHIHWYTFWTNCAHSITCIYSLTLCKWAGLQLFAMEQFILLPITVETSLITLLLDYHDRNFHSVSELLSKTVHLFTCVCTTSRKHKLVWPAVGACQRTGIAVLGLFVRPDVCNCLYVCVCLFVRVSPVCCVNRLSLFTFLLVYLPDCLFVCMHECLRLCLPDCLFDCLPECNHWVKKGHLLK